MVTMTGKELREDRVRLGMTQGELAEYLGTTLNTISRWERGEMGIAYPKMVRTMLDLKLAALNRDPAESNGTR